MTAEIGLSKKRYIVLVIFASLLAFQYGIIFNNQTSVLFKFYHISKNGMDFASISGTVLYLLLLFPSTFKIKKYGVRGNLILSATGLAVGSVINSFSVRPELFVVKVVGYYFWIIGYSFGFPLILQIPRIWFPSHQLARVVSVIYATIIIGRSLCNFVVNQIIPDTTKSDIGKGLSNFFIAQAAVSTVVLTAILLVVDEKPPNLPEISEVKAEEERQSLSYIQCWKSALNGNFILLVAVATMFTSSTFAYQIFVKQIFTENFEDKIDLWGRIRLYGSMLSAIAILVNGILIDKLKCYKHLYMTMTCFLCITYLCNYFSVLSKNLTSMLVLSVLSSLFSSGFVSLLNMVAEVNYPLPESISFAVISVGEQIATALFSQLIQTVALEFGNLCTFTVIIGTLLISCVLISFVKVFNRREEYSIEETKI